MTSRVFKVIHTVNTGRTQLQSYSSDNVPYKRDAVLLAYSQAHKRFDACFNYPTSTNKREFNMTIDPDGKYDWSGSDIESLGCNIPPKHSIRMIITHKPR